MRVYAFHDCCADVHTANMQTLVLAALGSVLTFVWLVPRSAPCPHVPSVPRLRVCCVVLRMACRQACGAAARALRAEHQDTSAVRQ